MAERDGTWAIYARISMDRTGAGLGVDRQIEDCRTLGRQLKLKGEPAIYTDNDISASSGKKRPEYERLMQALRTGRHQVLLVWHTDRLHRRMTELEDFISVATARSILTHSVQRGPIDLSTADGQLQARIASAVAQHEVTHKGDRRRRAAEQGASLGKRQGGGRSFGYGRTEIDADGRKRSVDLDKINRAEAAALRAAFDAILNGATTTSVWKRWNARGITTQHGSRWNGSNFRAVITRPSLAGIATYKGEVLEGVTTTWSAIIPRDKWQAVQAIISDPARKTSPGNQVRHLSSGVTYCECGLAMRAGTNSLMNKTTGEKRRYTVYRCSADRAGHSTILKHVLDFAVREAVIGALYEARDKPPQPRSSEDEAELIDLNTQLGVANAGMARLADAIADGILTPSAARSRSQKLRGEIDRLTAAIDGITRTNALSAAEDATYEAFWASFDPTGPSHVRMADGTRRLRPLQSFGRARIKAGATPDEAKAKVEIGERFDALGLDQQRDLVRSHLRVVVRRGSGADRVQMTQARQGRLAE